MTDPFRVLEEQIEERLQRERTFSFLGETFTHRPSVSPAVGIRYAKQFLIISAEVAVDAQETSDEQIIRSCDETVKSCLEPESWDAWDRLRADDARIPLTFRDIFQFAEVLLGRVAGIPTDAPTDSSDGRKATANGSKADSSSRAKTSKASA